MIITYSPCPYARCQCIVPNNGPAAITLVITAMETKLSRLADEVKHLAKTIMPDFVKDAIAICAACYGKMWEQISSQVSKPSIAKHSWKACQFIRWKKRRESHECACYLDSRASATSSN